MNMNRAYFVSFPRSGSNWYIQLLADSLGESHSYVHDLLMRKSHTKTYGIGMRKMFFMYRHPKDALLSYAKFIIRGKPVELSEVLLKKMLFTTENYRGRNFILWWKTLMNFFLKPEHQKLLCVLKYEDVLRSPEKEVKRGLEHLGFSCKPKVKIQMTHKTVKDRLNFYTGRWEREKVWTPKIDKMVTNQVGNHMEKYGYK